MSTKKDEIYFLRDLLSRINTRAKIANGFSINKNGEHGIFQDNWKGRAFAYKEIAVMIKQELDYIGDTEDDCNAIPRRSGIRLRR